MPINPELEQQFNEVIGQFFNEPIISLNQVSRTTFRPHHSSINISLPDVFTSFLNKPSTQLLLEPLGLTQKEDFHEAFMTVAPGIALKILTSPLPSPQADFHVTASQLDMDLQRRLLAATVLENLLQNDNNPPWLEDYLNLSRRTSAHFSPLPLFAVSPEDFAFCYDPTLRTPSLDPKQNIRKTELIDRYEEDIKAKAGKKENEILMRWDNTTNRYIHALHARLAESVISGLFSLQGNRVLEGEDIALRHLTNVDDVDLVHQTLRQFKERHAPEGQVIHQQIYAFQREPVEMLLSLAVREKRFEVLRSIMWALTEVTSPISDHVNNYFRRTCASEYGSYPQLQNPEAYQAFAPEMMDFITDLLLTNLKRALTDQNPGAFLGFASAAAILLPKLLDSDENRVYDRLKLDNAIELRERAEELIHGIVSLREATPNQTRNSDDMMQLVGALTIFKTELDNHSFS